MASGGASPPIPTFFDENEDLDLATLREHLTRLKAAGITGFVALGSNGEAGHLDRGERHAVIAGARATAGADGRGVGGAGTAPPPRALAALPPPPPAGA